MAGGIGSRFWPLSRTRKPKQFLDILGTGKTLLQQTFDRFVQIIPKENILIVSNEEYGELILKQLPGIRKEQILLEKKYCAMYCICKLQDSRIGTRRKDSCCPI